jgi:hypothetical protein
MTLPTTIIAAFLVATIADFVWVAVDAVVKFWRKYATLFQQQRKRRF